MAEAGFANGLPQAQGGVELVGRLGLEGSEEGTAPCSSLQLLCSSFLAHTNYAALVSLMLMSSWKSPATQFS